MQTTRAALNAFLRANETRVYDFGVWDCAVFAFGAVLAQTGIDHLLDYRGKYTDYDQAEALMREIDRVATVRSLVTAKLGEPIPAAMARTGDVVSYGPIVGVLYVDRGLFLTEPQGYDRVPRALIDRAWRVHG